MSASIQDLVLSIHNEDPTLSNEEIADLIQKRVPGSTTSAASVSSIKSKAKRAGLLSTTSVSGAAAYERLPTVSPEELPPETADERYARISRRFRTLHRMAEKVADGYLPALIVSGPPGLGKSFTVEQVLQDRYGDPVSTLSDDYDEDSPGYDIISGTMTPPGLLIALWKMRNGGVVVIDDCDDVFRDETCLNILKAVLDSSARRTVSYRKRAHWMEEMGIPTSFDFEGSVVFCTNIDFEAAIRKGSPMAPHFEALVDRSLYLSLTMRTPDDYITRIRQVALDEGLLEKKGMTPEQAQEVFDFIVENRERFYGLSLRLVGQIAICFKADPDTWRDDVEATKMRTF